MLQPDLLGTPGHAQPRCVTRQPHADVHAGGDRRCGNGEDLIDDLGALGATGRFHNKAAGGHGRQRRPTRRPAPVHPGVAGKITAMSTNALELIFLGLLVAATVTITWFAGYVVYKLYKGQR